MRVSALAYASAASSEEGFRPYRPVYEGNLPAESAPDLDAE
jgi:hypothetical protein